MELLACLDNTLLLNVAVIATLICWGAWGITDKLALDAAPPLMVMFCLNLFALPALVLSLGALYVLEPGQWINQPVLFWTGVAGVAYFIAMILYLVAMGMTDASFVLGITSGYPIILQFISTFFLKEPLVPVRLLGSALVLAGILAISWSARTGAEKLRLSPLLILLIVVTTLLWGIWGIFDKIALEAGSPLMAFAGKCLWDVLCLLALWVYLLRARKFEVPRTAGLWVPVSISAVCLYLGAFAYLVGLQLATASYIVSITGCYPLVMYLLALVILKERFNALRLLGILLITMGGIVTHTTQTL